MSSITAITRPLPGERVLDLSPAPDALASAETWLRRPNLFPGRTLTAATLEARSAWLTGRIATRGQAFTPGVVRGLEVEYLHLPPASGSVPPTVRFQIAAGQGLTVDGETVMVGEMDADMFALRVVAPVDVLEGGGFGDGELLERRISDHTLGQLIAAFPDALPLVGVLVLQPVSTQRADLDPDDGCDRCGCDGAVGYEDWRHADAVRLLWYVWPADWAGPPPAHDDPQRRNRLAHQIFDAERVLPPDGVLPWEAYGVPVALVGLDDGFMPAFVDHAAVARRGGQGRYGRLQLAAPSAGLLRMATHWRLPALWQAQLEQLAGHIAALVAAAERDGLPVPTATAMAAQFDRLPPAGLLPVDAIDTLTLRSGFFPAAMDLDAVPVPLDQLDLAIRECAGLAPLDLARGERVRVLVPVSQASYEPRLLFVETVDPEFRTTLARFLQLRSVALAARQSLRLKAAVLAEAMYGNDSMPVPPAMDADPNALEPELEALALWGPAPGNIGHRSQLRAGVHEHGFQGLTMPVGKGERLYVWVYLDPDAMPRTLMLTWQGGGATARAYWGENLIDRGKDGSSERLPMGALPEPGRWTRLEVKAGDLGLGLPEQNTGAVGGLMFTLFDGRAAYGGTGCLGKDGEQPWHSIEDFNNEAELGGDEPFELLSHAELLAPLEARFGVLPADDESIIDGRSEDFDALWQDPVLEVLSITERSQLWRRGVDGFIGFLQARADRADDIVDYGFVKVQTDLYRVRQIMLGATEASRLAISPALASIAQAETAVATHERIQDFLVKTRISRAPATKLAGLAAGESLRIGEGIDAPDATDANTDGGLFLRARSAVPASDAAQPATGGAVAFHAKKATLASGVSAFAGGGVSAGLGDAALAQAKACLANFVGTPLASQVAMTQIAMTQFDMTALAGAAPKKLIGTASAYSVKDISGATPLAGNINLRTVSLADRMKLPESQRARDYATLTRHEALQALLEFADALVAEDGAVPGLFDKIDVWGLAGDEFLKDVQAGGNNLPVLKRPFRDFMDPAKRNALFGKLLTVPERNQSDEGGYFSDSADMADRTIALFRQVEGRIRAYREVIARCQTTRDAIQAHGAAIGARERAWNERLEEARHDVSVTRALLAEEQARIDAINRRRRHVLDNEVRFLAYIRPRATDNLLDTPSHALDPGLLPAPVPACLQAHEDVPEELERMLAVLREAPAAWFVGGPALLDRLDRVDLLARTVRSAQVRALVAPQRAELLREVSPAPQAGRLLVAVDHVRNAQMRVVDQVRLMAQRIDVARMVTLGWRDARAEAAAVVSLGDLADGDHGQGPLARAAAALYDRFGHVCACLHAAFSGVAPSIRLDWAEVLSQFDDAPSLRSLAALQRWGEIDYAERRRMQGLVDWLFDQLDTGDARALALVNDIVRMCLLLASHAPIGRIIAGRLPRPVLARPGVRIPLVALDPRRLRIGMHALVYRGDTVVARAVVEDLGAGEASARVLHTVQAGIELDTTMRVQFAPAATVSLGGDVRAAAAHLGRS